MRRHTLAQHGQALVASYMLVLVLTILGGTLLNTAKGASQHSTVQRLDSQTILLAQGALEDAVRQFTSDIANYAVSATATCYPDTNLDAVCNPNTATQTDVLVTTFCTSDSAACPNSPYPAGSNPRAFAWAVQAEPTERTITDPDGTIVLVKNYQITAQATHPQNAGYTVTLNQVVARRLITAFQHAVFYEHDLEALPGANMTLTGRVHSNADMYLDCYGTNTLTLNTEYVRSAGSIYNKRKDTGVADSGEVVIKQAGTSNFPGMNNLDSPDATWTAESQSRWSGTVKSSVHGVTKRTVPSVGSIQPGGYFDQNANVKIVNGILYKNGVVLVEGVDIPVGTVITSTTLYDNREGKYAKTTDIDMRKLAGYAATDTTTPSFTNQLPSNGLMYATRNDAGSTYVPAIRLTNGTEIHRSGGLTIVSNDPVYVKGDYNTTSKKPTSVICDSMNILSNAWTDAGSSGALSGRVASNTTVNTAFIAGVKSTVGTTYSGGLENYPRLQEKWTSKTLTIRGAFIELWNSSIATGNWQATGVYYNAPVRNWDYDTDFLTGAMPPFTPWAVEVDRGAWWKQ